MCSNCCKWIYYTLATSIYLYFFCDSKANIFQSHICITVSHIKHSILNCIYLADIGTFMSSSQFSDTVLLTCDQNEIMSLTSSFDPCRSYLSATVMWSPVIGMKRSVSAGILMHTTLRHSVWDTQSELSVHYCYICIPIEPKGVVRKFWTDFSVGFFCVRYMWLHIHSEMFLIASHFLGKPMQTKS